MLPKPPEQPPMWAPTQQPTSTSSLVSTSQSHLTKTPIDFSPPLIAMVVVAAAAFLIITYSRLISRYLRRFKRSYRRWRWQQRQGRFHFPPSDTDSFQLPYESPEGGFYVYSPYGLDEAVIKNIPLKIYKPPRESKSSKMEFYEVDDFLDCAVCLLEFEDGDYMRTLPNCCHSFHADCIDMWLRAHATCPLCRAGGFFIPTPLESPMIRPILDDGMLLQSVFLAPLSEIVSGEIQPDRTPTESRRLFSPEAGENRRTIQSEDHRYNRGGGLDFLLKRSHSFSFERSFASERIALGASTTPHRHQWMKRPSSTPFSSIAKSRVFSFRHYRGAITKSPGFFRRRGLFPMSESSASLRYGKGRSRGMKSSSRMRMGDPEALISPERYGRHSVGSRNLGFGSGFGNSKIW